MKPKSEHGGRGRLLSFFERRQGEWVRLPEILRLGVAQYNARIKQLREEGYTIENRTEWREGIKHSEYRFTGKKSEDRNSIPRRGEDS